MSTERLIENAPASAMSSTHSLRHYTEPTTIFEELPKVTIIGVSRPDASDISPLLLSYTIQVQYKQFKWRLLKKASQVIYLQFELRKCAIIEELHEKQEQVKEWLHHIGIGEQTAVLHDDDEDDRGGTFHSVQITHVILTCGYVCLQVCKFLEVSKLSFLPEYGPKLKENYVMVKHLSKVPKEEENVGCCICYWSGCCKSKWQKVWAVLKPGYLALLNNPFDAKLLDIIVFDVFPTSNGKGENANYSHAKVDDWISAINDAVLKPPEGWCNPHRFGSFAPLRGTNDDATQAQWFIDGKSAFEAIASSIESAKSEIYITGWWLCPELYLRRPFHNHSSSRLDALLETKAKEGVQRVRAKFLGRCHERMPWHDVHCALWGPPCRDIARHFVQRWNHAKRSKAPNEQTIPLLMPQHHMVLPHYMGRNREVEIESKTAEPNSKDLNGQDPFPSGSPPEDIPLLLPQEADCDEEVSSADEKLTGLVIRSVSQWSAGTTQTEDSIHKAYCSLIEEAEHFVFSENFQNQFFISGLAGDEIIRNRVADALYRRIRRAHKENRCFRVIIVIPLLPGFQGGLDDIGAATVRALMHWQYQTICKGNSSILHNLNALLGPETRDYISFYGLRTHGQLSDVCPMFTSQVYVHSKVMIVDDRIAVVGSSNINDRSLLGSRDSEICVVIEDKDFIDSTMDGKPWKAGKFAFSLRVSLWAGHLGLRAEEICQIKDPVADSTYKDIWMATAESNVTIYQDVFSCIPNDRVHSRSELRQCMNHCV
ncbi:hypothetical protein RND71_000747 [Anisodus tanguticus]|uniref:phospholipase D n=1 Tax=Anisodus tanguticus TaxID=243964 RepID=A0AAE1SYY9_9SOLA|nr:hypothetical protein RND71_000747 [Anisodus tanguticus]